MHSLVAVIGGYRYRTAVEPNAVVVDSSGR